MYLQDFFHREKKGCVIQNDKFSDKIKKLVELKELKIEFSKQR